MTSLNQQATLSLLVPFINYGRKKFYNITSWGQFYKTFFVRSLLIFVISSSVLKSSPGTDESNKHSSLLRKSVHYRQKSFIRLSAVQCLVEEGSKLSLYEGGSKTDLVKISQDFLQPQFTKIHNKLECLPLAGLSSLVIFKDI